MSVVHVLSAVTETNVVSVVMTVHVMSTMMLLYRKHHRVLMTSSQLSTILSSNYKAQAISSKMLSILEQGNRQKGGIRVGASLCLCVNYVYMDSMTKLLLVTRRFS